MFVPSTPPQKKKKNSKAPDFKNAKATLWCSPKPRRMGVAEMLAESRTPPPATLQRWLGKSETRPPDILPTLSP